MATTKTKSKSTKAKSSKGSSSKSKTSKTSRCWAGYEPVPGKKPHEQGSCKKK